MNFSALIQSHLAKCGIELSQKSSKNHPLNVKNSMIFTLVFAAFCLTAYSFTEANTFDESMNILFQSVGIYVCGTFYAIMVWSTSKLFELINHLADTVKESE